MFDEVFSRCAAVLACAALGCLFSCASAFAPDEPTILEDGEWTSNYTAAEFAEDWRNYDSSGDSHERLRLRNRIVNSTMNAISANYHLYEKKLFTNRAAQDTGFDLASIGLDSAVALVGGAHTKTVLGIVAAAVHGIEGSINSNYFRDATTEVLLGKMRAKRAERVQLIRKKMALPNSANPDVNSYPLEESWGDLITLYYVGTLHSALLDVKQSAAKEAEDAKKQAIKSEKERIRVIVTASDVAIDTRRDIFEYFATKTLAQRRKIIEVLLGAQWATEHASNLKTANESQLKKWLRGATTTTDEKELRAILDAMKKA